MNKHWIDALIVAPMITGSLACTIVDGNTTDASNTASATDTATDTATGTDTDAETETGSVGGLVTIYEIQQGMVPEEDIVQLENVVISTPVQSEKSAMFVQEMAGGEYSGIYIYMYDEVLMGLDLAPGDVVNLKGQYTEFYESSQITVSDPSDLTIVSSGAPPVPEVVNAADVATGGSKSEAYESVLISVENVMVSNPSLEFGGFEVDSSLYVTDFFFPKMGPEVTQGASIERISGALIYSFSEFRIAPRSVSDIEGIGGGNPTTSTTTDTTSTSTTNGTGGNGQTIYDLQMDMVQPNTPVEVVDVVVTTGPTYKGDVFYVEEMAGGKYSGISVYLKNADGLAIVPGDLVTLNGVFDEFYDNSQIELADVSGITITGSAPVPMPELVAAADIATGGSEAEAYEGVLVEIENVDVTNPDLDFGEFEVTGGLHIDDLFFTNNWPMVMLGDSYSSLVGVMDWSFDERKLAPRDLADMTAN